MLNTPAILDAAREATTELIAYMDEVVAQRRHAPEADILTALSQAEEDGERLSHEELLAFSILLLLAGHETTSNLIGNGLLALAARPELAASLRADRVAAALGGRGAAALRQQRAGRRALRAPGGGAARPHDRAGRGPCCRWSARPTATRSSSADPDELDIERSPNRHLAFGRGIHFCLGAPLARLEGEIAFAALLDRFPELRVAEDGVERAGTLLLRGVGRLELEV